MTPNQIKYRLAATAITAINPDGSLAYSIFQQGAGLVDVAGAVASTDTTSANQGMNISYDLDIDGTTIMLQEWSAPPLNGP